MAEWLDPIDDEDRVIGRAPRARIRAENLLHRGAGILVFNRRGELYIHRRTETKDVFPGMYDMLVGGAVASGESYGDAARREVAWGRFSPFDEILGLLSRHPFVPDGEEIFRAYLARIRGSGEGA